MRQGNKNSSTISQISQVRPAEKTSERTAAQRESNGRSTPPCAVCSDFSGGDDADARLRRTTVSKTEAKQVDGEFAFMVFPHTAMTSYLTR